MALGSLFTEPVDSLEDLTRLLARFRPRISLFAFFDPRFGVNCPNLPRFWLFGFCFFHPANLALEMTSDYAQHLIVDLAVCSERLVSIDTHRLTPEIA